MFGIRNNIVASVMLHTLMFAAAFMAGSSSELNRRSMISVSLVDSWNAASEGSSKNAPGQQQHPLTVPPMDTNRREVPARKPSRVLPRSPVHAPSDPEALNAPSFSPDDAASTSPVLHADGGGVASAENSLSSVGAADPAPASAGNAMRISTITSGMSGAGQQQGSSGDASLRQKIRAALQANLVYPYIARKRQMEGSVMVRFKINQAGKPEAIRIMKGSGYSILDSAAQETVVKASPFPAANNFVEVPITFTLKDP